MNKNQKYFSIIELLVVIAVIVVLLTLTMPTLSGTLSRTKSLSCNSRLNLLGSGYNQLVKDFEGGRIVGYRDFRWLDGPNSPVNWHTRIRKHIFKGQYKIGGLESGTATKKENLETGGQGLLCPHDQFYNDYEPGETTAVFKKYWYSATDDLSKYSSYGLNATGIYIDNPKLNELNPMVSQITHPDKLYLIADSGYNYISAYLLFQSDSSRKLMNWIFGEWTYLYGISRHGPHSNYDLVEDESKRLLIPEMEVNIVTLDGKAGGHSIQDLKYDHYDPENTVRFYGVKYSNKGKWWLK